MITDLVVFPQVGNFPTTNCSVKNPCDHSAVTGVIARGPDAVNFCSTEDPRPYL